MLEHGMEMGECGRRLCGKLPFQLMSDQMEARIWNTPSLSEEAHVSVC